jgi:hypothetical protein
VHLAPALILNGIICATPQFCLWTLASPASSGAFEVPGRGQPHLAEHSLGQW